MSPTSTTGTSVARAKPILAMSPLRRFTSVGLPAPSTITRSCADLSRSNASITMGSRLPRFAIYAAASSLRSALPFRTTCARRSPSGLRSKGFMSVDGCSPAARAWSACARPISPPPGQAAALFDIFCGLKGAASIPRRRAIRQSPATSSDLPTSEPVPCSMIARPVILRYAGPRMSSRKLAPLREISAWIPNTRRRRSLVKVSSGVPSATIRPSCIQRTRLA